MKIFRILILMVLVAGLTSCYDDFEGEFEYSTIGFVSQQPLRTLVADTDMTIKVGVSIGGFRTVQKNATATFEIDETLLDGTGLTLLPETHYSLSDPNTMKVTNTNLNIADVEITFTEDFYKDAKVYGVYYALPFKMTNHSMDQLINENADHTVVAIKAISKYHGAYYVQGEMYTLDANGNRVEGEVVSYNSPYLNENTVREFSTVSRYTVQRPGFEDSNNPEEAISITVAADESSVSIVEGGSVPITNASAALAYVDGEPVFSLTYRFERDGGKYEVEEKLTRRQNPMLDLRFEEWN